MYYIPGNNFVFNPRAATPAPLGKGSIQEQIALSRQGRSASAFDSRFVVGHKYRLANIKKIQVDSKDKVRYLFANETDRQLPDIDINFDNTSAADDYIANIAGQSQQLLEARQALMKLYESSKEPFL